MNPYIGHPSQLYGVEEHRLVGGKGDGMRLLEVNNGRGLELTLSPDRNLDIARLRAKGINLSYMSPCGYAAPAFYESKGADFLKTFTAGFLTTCGLQSVGSPCTDEGEELPLHGSIGNTPAEQVNWMKEDGAIVITSLTRDETIFGRKLVLERRIAVSLTDNSFTLTDKITNTGERVEPVEILYHMNMGYPLLDEESVVKIPAKEVIARDANAKKYIDSALEMEKPTPHYQERCYYYVFDTDKASASIYQPKIGTGLTISFDPQVLDGFVEWKMMGVRDYVLGLECGNCYPDGRDVMRKTGMLKQIEPGESLSYSFEVSIS